MLSENERLRKANEDFAKENFKLRNKVAKYERVARAAEGAWPFMFDDIPKALDSKRSRYEELYDALADLPEDALGG